MNRNHPLHVRRTFPRFALAVASIAFVACSPSIATVGDNLGANDAGPATDAGAKNDASTVSPCAAAAVPALGCASGPTELVCDQGASPPRWSVVCPGNSGTPSEAGATPCDGVGAITIGCTAGQPTYTCDTWSGPPQWKVSCPPGPSPLPSDCCPAGFVLSGGACIVDCAPGQLCSQIALVPHCSDGGSPGGPAGGDAAGEGAADAALSVDGGQDARVSGCCPVGFQMTACTFEDGGAGLACHNPAMGCASSSSCGVGCDPVVIGRCGL